MTTIDLGRAAAPRRASFDLSRPIFVALAALLVILVVLPLVWLAYYSLVDHAGNFTLANFAALATDLTLRRPFLIAIGMALGVGLLSVPDRDARSPGSSRAPTCPAAASCAPS